LPAAGLTCQCIFIVRRARNVMSIQATAGAAGLALT
jgi:hypothetical protein